MSTRIGGDAPATGRRQWPPDVASPIAWSDPWSGFGLEKRGHSSGLTSALAAAIMSPRLPASRFVRPEELGGGTQVNRPLDGRVST